MERLAKTLHELEIGGVTANESLAMWPLLGSEEGAVSYLLLDEAIQAGLASVTEISEAGRVPEMKLTNDADRPVLVLEGEELRGGKQNRTTNLTILAPPRTTIIIPVSCVESGRWHASNPVAEVSEIVHMARGRAAKAASVSWSLRHEGIACADQGRVWRDIDEAAQQLHAPSPTGAMSDIFATHRSRIGELVAGFRPVERQLGALFAVDGEPVGFDLFGHHSTLCEMLPKLARSYAIDALRTGTGTGAAAGAQAVRWLIDSAASATVEVFAAVGLGTTVRLSADGVVGGGLIHHERVIHLAAFAIEERRHERENNGRGMASPSARRRGYRH